MNDDKSVSFRIPEIRTFECRVWLTGRVEGEFADWPANLQDELMKALERKADEVKRPLVIVASECGYVEADKPPFVGRWYARVIASEVVAGIDPNATRH